jgi:hypothetical protein
VKKRSGDLEIGELSNRVNEEERNLGIVKALKEHGGNKVTTRMPPSLCRPACL